VAGLEEVHGALDAEALKVVERGLAEDVVVVGCQLSRFDAKSRTTDNENGQQSFL